MAIVITVGGIDVTKYVRLESVKIHNTIVATTDNMDMTISWPTGIGPSIRPQAGNQVTCIDGGTTHFAGILTQADEEMVNPNHLKWTCQVRDYVWLFDRRMAVRIYTGVQAADVAVKDIVNSYTSGFTTNNVQAAPNINPQVFDYVYPSAVMRTIADQLQWGWYIDYSKDVHFFKMETSAAPVSSINFDTSINTDYRDLKLRETIDQERNRIYLKGYAAKSTTQATDRFTGNGSQTQYPLYSAPWDTSSISVTRNGVTQNIKTEFSDGQPGDGTGGANDAYICFDNMGLRFGIAPSNNDAIVATYNFQFPGITAVEDPAAQALMLARENTGDGIHEYAIQDPALNDSVAIDRGNAYLKRYAYPRLTGEFDSFTQGWRSGQTFTGISTVRMGGFNQIFYVQKVTKKIASHPSGGTPVFDHHVEFSDNPQGL